MLQVLSINGSVRVKETDPTYELYFMALPRSLRSRTGGRPARHHDDGRRLE